MTMLLQKTILSSSEDIALAIADANWYLIKITASVKSEKQRGKNETDDEELIIKIDDTTFPKFGIKQALFNSPAAFNGGKLHNREKTVYILIQLQKGGHTITLTPQHAAEIIEVSYETLHIVENQMTLSLHQEADDRDRKPWVTLVIVDNDIETVTITTKLWWRWFDGDDIQVIVDNKLYENDTSLFHKKWIFSARPIVDLFGRMQTETFSIVRNAVGLHYIELFSDRKPLLQSITVTTYKTKSPIVKSYKQGPQGEDYNRFDKEIIEGVSFWNNYFGNQQYPPSEQLDPSLVKAIIYIESSMGYYKAPEGAYPAYPDVMQIGDEANPAIHTLNNDGWIDPETKNVARENIWTEDAVVRYNGGGDPAYKEKVYNIYLKGVGWGGMKLWAFILLALLLPVFLSVFVLFYYQNTFFISKEMIARSDSVYSPDYRFEINTLDGLRLRSFEFARYYGDSQIPWTFDKDSTLALRDVSISANNGTRILIVSGTNIAKYHVVSLIRYSNRSFNLIKNESEYGGVSETFDGDNVLVENRDDDPEPEVIEEHFIPYANAPDQWWSDYYDFDQGKDRYVLISRQKEVVLTQL